MDFINKICVGLILLLFPLTVQAQTYFSPVVGVDYSRINENPSFSWSEMYIIHEQGYSTRSYFFGGSIEKVLHKNTSLQLEINYTKKTLRSSIKYIFIPIQKVSFDWYRTSILLKFNQLPVQNISAGIGPILQYYTNYKQHHKAYIFDKGRLMQSNFKSGVKCMIGYELYGVVLKAYYNFGIDVKRDENVFLQPVRSFGISLGYKFDLSK